MINNSAVGGIITGNDQISFSHAQYICQSCGTIFGGSQMYVNGVATRNVCECIRCQLIAHSNGQ